MKGELGVGFERCQKGRQQDGSLAGGGEDGRWQVSDSTLSSLERARRWSAENISPFKLYSLLMGKVIAV